MKVLNIGSLNYDYTYTVQNFLQPGETQSSLNFQIFCGGKGLNQSIALARAGISVYHGGIVGDDGEELIEVLEENNVNTKYIKKCKGKSGHAIIQLNEKGENCILLHGGTNQNFRREYIEEILAEFESGDILLLQNEINELPFIVDKAFEKGMYIVLNPSPFNEELKNCDFKKISMFFINEIEGNQITGADNPENIINTMKEKYPQSQIVLTLGESGVWYADENKLLKEDALKIKVIDTTAAGDTFTGYFVSGMIEQTEVQENLKRSTKAAAIAVSRKGAMQSIPLKEEVI